MACQACAPLASRNIAASGSAVASKIRRSAGLHAGVGVFAEHVLVEINLTSNTDILKVRGKDHPFSTYRKFGVPVALSTDDEGVACIDLTLEYVRAVETYDLTYADLKQMVRNSLESSCPAPAFGTTAMLMPVWLAVWQRSTRRRSAFPALRGLPQGERKGRAAMGARTPLSGV
jgi:Adenosine deaminase